ncbi:hypothetical protein [Variovorax sp. OV329]|uniref:hypothetical protein n=1 Tax=Variovorax sp. OV329 TaxID=1882825 RepID=UPI0011142914|nr:hypothetical protein [Variovorax sp. OV329]
MTSERSALNQRLGSTLSLNLRSRHCATTSRSIGSSSSAWSMVSACCHSPGRFYAGWITPELVGPFKGKPGSAGW